MISGKNKESYNTWLIGGRIPLNEFAKTTFPCYLTIKKDLADRGNLFPSSGTRAAQRVPSSWWKMEVVFREHTSCMCLCVLWCTLLSTGAEFLPDSALDWHYYCIKPGLKQKVHIVASSVFGDFYSAMKSLSSESQLCLWSFRHNKHRCYLLE